MKTNRSLHTIDDLLAAGLMGEPDAAAGRAVAERYAVAVTPAVVSLIDRDDPADPIARQFVPDPRELVRLPEERDDPIGDGAHAPVEGIVHRYPDRVLLKAVHVCPVYCRFCFRREMVGPEGLGTLSADALDRAIDYIAGHSAIWEVILTGGDPLVLSARRLSDLIARLGRIPHVSVVRIHSRVPVVEPERIDAALVDALTSSGKTVVVAVHANHPRELTAIAKAGLDRLHRAGVVLVSQSVLLRGVNDDVETLAALMRSFVAARVTPYYLHHPDLAPGTAHFRVGIAEGQALVAALRGRLSGLCQPRYVLDIPGGYGKAMISAPEIVATSDGHVVSDYRGGQHAYPPQQGD